MMATRFALGFLVALALGACSRSEASATEVSLSASQAMTALSSPVQENANYKVTLEPVGTYKAGQQGTVNVVLVTKGAYHINKQYPYKFVCEDPAADGVSYPKTTVRRDDGTYEERKAVLPVPFVPSKAGEVKVAGVFSLSVCTESNCLLDKAPLELRVKVE